MKIKLSTSYLNLLSYTSHIFFLCLKLTFEPVPFTLFMDRTCKLLMQRKRFTNTNTLSPGYLTLKNTLESSSYTNTNVTTFLVLLYKIVYGTVYIVLGGSSLHAKGEEA